MAEAAALLGSEEVESDQAAADAKAIISEGLTELEGQNKKLQTQQAMDNDQAAADSAYYNGQITAKN